MKVKLSDTIQEDVIHPVLMHLQNAGGLVYTAAAESLLLGTMAQESKLGLYARQLGHGPALGPFQMEPNTHDDLWENYLNYRPRLANAVMQLSYARKPGWLNPDASELWHNWRYAAAMCRMHYIRVPESLPMQPDDIEALARYWKKYYNTMAGKGTVEEFI